jgi:hypothetical protein
LGFPLAVKPLVLEGDELLDDPQAASSPPAPTAEAPPTRNWRREYDWLSIACSSSLTPCGSARP